MQVYRGMDIGTAKATREERRSIPHHLIDIIEPGQPFSVADFQKAALEAIRKIRAKGKLPILVGGTGLYVEALLHYPSYTFVKEGRQAKIRRKWEAFLAERGEEALHKEAMKADPKAAGRLHPNDTRRLIRILEEYEQTGIPPSHRIPDPKERLSPFDALLIGLYLPREHLYRRIEERVDRMLEEGLIDEVSRLLARGIPPDTTAMQGLGYKEMVPYLKGETSLEAAVTEIKKRTRQYAKRQRTWFRHMEEIHWFSMEEGEKEEALQKIDSLVAGKFSYLENK